MPLGRAIIVAVLAAAVALLPASGGTALASPLDAGHGHPAAVELSAGEPVDAAPCDHATSAVDDCGSISACAVKCFTYAGLRLPTLATPLAVAIALPLPATEIVDLAAGAPPFRPPRADAA
jgi:hypothetical protein